MRKKNGAVPVTLAPYSARLYQEVMPALDPDEKKFSKAGNTGKGTKEAGRTGSVGNRKEENGKTCSVGNGKAEGRKAGSAGSGAKTKSARTYGSSGENRKDK